MKRPTRGLRKTRNDGRKGSKGGRPGPRIYQYFRGGSRVAGFDEKRGSVESTAGSAGALNLRPNT